MLRFDEAVRRIPPRISGRAGWKFEELQAVGKGCLGFLITGIGSGRGGSRDGWTWGAVRGGWTWEEAVRS